MMMVEETTRNERTAEAGADYVEPETHRTEGEQAREDAQEDIREERVRQPLFRLKEQLDYLVDEITGVLPAAPWRRRHRPGAEYFRSEPYGWGAGEIPVVEVVDKDNEILVHAELPGMTADDVVVDLSASMLTISGEKREERVEGEKEGSYYVAERRYGRFRRSFPIPPDIDQAGVTASFRRGVLTIMLPKTAEAKEKTRRVDIRSEG
jgi:HSP20 family protein